VLARVGSLRLPLVARVAPGSRPGLPGMTIKVKGFLTHYTSIQSGVRGGEI